MGLKCSIIGYQQRKMPTVLLWAGLKPESFQPGNLSDRLPDNDPAAGDALQGGGNMYLPEIFKKFMERHSEIADAYRKVGNLCTEAGPIDLKTQHLIQLGVSIGMASKGGVRSHVVACAGFGRHQRGNNSDRAHVDDDSRLPLNDRGLRLDR